MTISLLGENINTADDALEYVLPAAARVAVRLIIVS